MTETPPTSALPANTDSAVDTPLPRPSNSAAPRSRFRPGDYFIPVGFIAIHLAALLVFVVPFSWTAVGLCAGFYCLRLFGITAGLHRYFSHRGFKTGRVFQFILGWLGASAVQGGPLWWAATHRKHHRLSDQEGDPHSPIVKSAFYSHAGWILTPGERDADLNSMKDFDKYPELRVLNTLHYLTVVVQAAICYAIDGWSGVVWGVFLSTVLLWHATFLVNSVCHIFGSRRFETTDASRNNFLVALVVFGEGWHNNHHHYPSSARQGFAWYEIDVTYYILKSLSWVGIVWDLRQPTQRALASKLIKS